MGVIIGSETSGSSRGFEEGLLEYMVSCSIVFEEKIAELYEHVSKKLPPPIAEILLHVARESRNHAEFFKFLGKFIGMRITECKENKVVSYIDDLLGKARNQGLSIGEVKEILSECVDLEESIGEEYHVKILSQLIRVNLKVFSHSLQGLGGLRTILEEISMEENYHASLVEYVLENIESILR